MTQQLGFDNVQLQQIAAMMASLIDHRMASITGIINDSPKMQPVTRRRRDGRQNVWGRAAQQGAGYINSTMVAAMPVQQAQPYQRQSHRQRSNKPKAVYGTSVSADGLSAKDVHEKRLAQLEAAVPGIGASKLVRIQTIGRDPADEDVVLLKDCSNSTEITNSPFTWISLPHPQTAYQIGAMDNVAIRTAVKVCGYGWSQTNEMWGTDGQGCPVRRQRYGATGAPRAALDSQE